VCAHRTTAVVKTVISSITYYINGILQNTGAGT
jgi:hypothetical protein